MIPAQHAPTPMPASIGLALLVLGPHLLVPDPTFENEHDKEIPSPGSLNSVHSTLNQGFWSEKYQGAQAMNHNLNSSNLRSDTSWGRLITSCVLSKSNRAPAHSQTHKTWDPVHWDPASAMTVTVSLTMNSPQQPIYNIGIPLINHQLHHDSKPILFIKTY